MVRLGDSQINYNRIRFLQGLIVGMFILLSCVVFYRQYAQGNYYKQLNNQQCLRRIIYPGQRGSILDCKGRPLALQKPIYCLYVRLDYFRRYFEPFCKKNHDRSDQQEQLWSLIYDALLSYAQQLGPIPFDVTSRQLFQHYHQNILLPLKLSQELSEEVYACLLNKLSAMDPFQVGIEWVRTYPYGSVACHVIGYVSKVDEVDERIEQGKSLRTFVYKREQGRTGIELMYDETLRGGDGVEIWRVTPGGQKQNCVWSSPSTTGETVKLSLDIELQKVCEKAMANRKGSVVIVDIATGGVLAMLSHPGFNLNDLVPILPSRVYKDIEQRGAWLNRATQGLYPMGSSFKPIALSALLRTGVVNEDTSYVCTGLEMVGNRSFHCHNRYGHGAVNTIQAMGKSCNTFFYHYGVQLGPDALYDEAVIYHFNEPTGIDLPYEVRTFNIPSPKWKEERFGERWTPGDTANMSIGQGYWLVTPMQMVRFAAAFSRNHTNFKPYLVKATPYKIEKALPDAQWEIVKAGMVQAAKFYLPSFDNLAVKSGTAQIKVKGHSEYWHIGWLIGFAPVNDPKIAFCIQIEQGQSGVFYGGSEASPIAAEFLHYLFPK